MKKNSIYVLGCIAVSILTLCANFASAGQHRKKPSVEIRPEIYLDLGDSWSQSYKERLPWPLEITITAVDSENKILAGPMVMVTSENLVGAEFHRAASIKPTQTDEEKKEKTKTFSTPEGISTILEKLEFAAYVTHEGAYSIYVRGFTRLTIQTDKSSETYQTMTTRECWPKKELVFAEFPGVKLKIKTRWLD